VKVGEKRKPLALPGIEHQPPSPSLYRLSSPVTERGVQKRCTPSVAYLGDWTRTTAVSIGLTGLNSVCLP
jgi:hypothetical protein